MPLFLLLVALVVGLTYAMNRSSSELQFRILTRVRRRLIWILILWGFATIYYLIQVWRGKL